MMTLKVCIFVASVYSVTAASTLLNIIGASTGLSPATGLISLAGDPKLLYKGLVLAGSAVDVGTGLVKNASSFGTGVARLGISSGTEFGAHALHGGVKVANQGLDFLHSAGDHFGTYGTAIKLGANVGQMALGMANTVGQKGLDMAGKKGDKALSLGNSVVQVSADKINSAAQMGLNLGKTAVSKYENVTTYYKGVVDKVNPLKWIDNGLPSGIVNVTSPFKLFSRFG